jgi:hypothetical protein
MPKKISSKVLQSEIKGRVREFYPYFLGFYLFSLLVSYFSKTWSGFFYWPAFHGSIILFSLFFIFAFKFNFQFLRGRQISYSIKNFIHLKFYLGAVRLTKNSAHQVLLQLRLYFLFISSHLAKLSRYDWLKIMLIVIILIFSLTKEIGVLDFGVLLYALVSFLFIIDSRYAAGAAIVFLAACPFLLIFKQNLMAENSAIYAYYLLVITVLTQVRELKRDGKKSKILSK